MTRLINYLKPILLGSCFLITGCQKYLQETNPSSISFENYYTSPEHAESAVSAIYHSTRSVYTSGGLGGCPYLMLEFITGLTNSVTLGAAGPTNSSIRMLNINSDNNYLNSYWNNYYQGIANANVAIAKIPGINMNETRKNSLLGEAYFLRAYFYFNLVRIFGDIPLILEPLDKTSPELFAARSAVSEIYTAIVQDLQTAEGLGLPFTDPTGRVSLGAVKSLLASVYLTMAGYPLQLGNDYYQKARDKAYEVISSGKYRLFDSYEPLRTDSEQNTGEFIFMVQFAQNVAQNSNFPDLFMPYGVNISSFVTETGMISPVEEFVASYDDADLRKAEKQFFFREFTLASDRNTPVDIGGWHIFKWLDLSAIETGISSLNWPVLRYAEVLMVFAEAENEVSGPTTDAYDAINLIRDRAELGDLSGLSEDAFRKAVWKERWQELCYENKTWFDMTRLRKAYDLVNSNFVDLVGHQTVYGPTYKPMNLLFPIPTSELLNNPNLTQNDGY